MSDPALAADVDGFLAEHPVPQGAKTGRPAPRADAGERRAGRSARPRAWPRRSAETADRTVAAVQVFAVEDTTAQLVWRRAHPGTVVVRGAGPPIECPTEAGPGSVVVEGLPPATTTVLEVTLPGAPPEPVAVTTGPAIPGPERVRIATVSDLHLGLHTFGLFKTVRERAAPRRSAVGPLRRGRAGRSGRMGGRARGGEGRPDRRRQAGRVGRGRGPPAAAPGAGGGAPGQPRPLPPRRDRAGRGRPRARAARHRRRGARRPAGHTRGAGGHGHPGTQPRRARPGAGRSDRRLGRAADRLRS